MDERKIYHAVMIDETITFLSEEDRREFVGNLTDVVLCDSTIGEDEWQKLQTWSVAASLPQAGRSTDSR